MSIEDYEFEHEGKVVRAIRHEEEVYIKGIHQTTVITKQDTEALVKHFGLIDEWVSVEKEIPTCMAIAYTPDTDESMTYRIIPAGLFKQVATDATHWKPLPAPPKD